jgi:anaerobic dimethyl sulfoxide reductase subunit B (iron-sulfur subunit)
LDERGESWHNNTFTYYLSIACNHCDEPVCVSGCPTGAMHKREEDGLVLVDDNICVGCRYCEMRCPYGAPQFDAQAKVMRKCDGCLDRLEKICVPSVWTLAHSAHSISLRSISCARNMVRRMKSRRCRVVDSS